jgi:hypothetical protein
MSGTREGAMKRARCPLCRAYLHPGKACWKRGAKGTPVLERIEARTIKAGPDDCWLWRGARTKSGYAMTSIKGKNVYVGRVLLDILGRPDLDTRHTCDNPPCVNPAHLVAGTRHENHVDMVQRKRSNRGEKHWNWKGGNSRNYREGRNRLGTQPKEQP